MMPVPFYQYIIFTFLTLSNLQLEALGGDETILNQSECEAAVGKAPLDCTYSDDEFDLVNQKDYPLCWAFAASALYREQLCTEQLPKEVQESRCISKAGSLPKVNCDVRVSPFSPLQCGGASLKRGSYETKGFRCLNRMGACKTTRFLSLLKKEDILSAFKKVSNACTDGVEGRLPLTAQQLAPLRQIAGLDISLHEDELYERYYDGETVTAWVRNTLNDACESGGRLFVKETISPREIYKRSVPMGGIFKFARSKTATTKKAEAIKQLTVIAGSLKKGVSAMASICAAPFLSETKLLDLSEANFSANKSCRRHALLVRGAKWNSESNRCEVWIGNSWGISDLQGWIPFDKLSKSLFELSSTAR